MERKGILFQGLSWHITRTVSYVREEPVYREEKNALYLEQREETTADATYLFLYAMSKNVRCRGKLRGMTEEWRNYLEREAGRSSYQKKEFWELLQGQERENARVLLGLLEKLRRAQEGEAQRALACFTYLVLTSYPKEREGLRGKKKLSGTELEIWTQGKEEPFAARLGHSCVILLLAELQRIPVIKDQGYERLCRQVKESGILWDFSQEEWGKGVKILSKPIEKLCKTRYN